MSDQQHNHQGCDCVDSATCNCECHPIKAATQILEIQLKESLQAADELAKVVRERGGMEILGVESALTAYERARGINSAKPIGG